MVYSKVMVNQLKKILGFLKQQRSIFSGVARAFPGGRLAHPDSQNEESLRKNEKEWSKFEEKMWKVELLPTRDCEARYGSEYIN